jgi:glucosamine--fructose-6-phosphate aminotransferase (isomerizing)
VACGTSYYAGLAGKYYIERLAQAAGGGGLRQRVPLPRRPSCEPTHLVLALTQSGETVDTLAALEEARSQGAFTAAIVNAIGSQAARVTDGHIYMQAGPEIGVASTKAFTASVTDQLPAGALPGAGARGRLLSRAERARPDPRCLATLPGLAGELLEGAWRGRTLSPRLAERFHTYHNFMYLGRGMQLPDRARRRAQAQGDQLHPRRGLCRGRDEARSRSR